MERREFLKILGLGGVALTLPKQLDIVAARMEDIKGPPLHVGYAEIRESDARHAFAWAAFGMRTVSLLPMDRHIDYLERWCVRVFMRRGEDRSTRVPYLQMPAHMVPDPSMVARVLNEEGKPAVVPRLWHKVHPWFCYDGEVTEVWVVPADRRNLPKYPLPKLHWVMQGYKWSGNPSFSSRHMILYSDIKTVQVDRASAIELGIVGRDEPEGVLE